MSLFAPSGGRAAKFLQVGTTVTGKIAQMPFEKQATKFGSQDLDFWPNGDPKMDIVVPLEDTNVPHEDANDDGARTIYVSSKNMRTAIAQAIQAAGQQDVAIGGLLTVTYVGNDPNSKNPANPAKLYQAQYTPPASGLAASAPAAAQQAPAPQQPPAPQADGFNALPAGVTQEQADKAKQLLAIGALDHAQIGAALGITAEQVGHIAAGTF
ncbi:hypothetical protein [Leucobacter tenebrionis]|uniref:hypothetical protein n=1 Tax=Leucobacter tenebrionis TaxID=2873270 RepID=UPI001CA60A2D|nr:hypothetical protein [Leucobacter tenebrionis]QZY52902.1 hypothetical protein KVY00_05565 [Leucobacter tenebrionis]